jgi:hypothetical protein
MPVLHASPLPERLRGKRPRQESNLCTRFRKSSESVRSRSAVSAESSRPDSNTRGVRTTPLCELVSGLSW